MPRQLQSKIHSDFSSETYKWEIYQAQAQELFDNSTSKADFNAHLIREYNRKINNLNQPSQLYFQPYDAGFSLTSNVLDGLKLSLDLNFDANTTYSQSTVGSTTFTLASRYGPNASFSRLSPATFRGSNGLIQYAPENLLPRSQEFDNAAWVSNRLNVTGTPTWVNATVAPDGTSTADFLIPDNISGNHRIRQINITTANVGYTLSFYAKANGYNYLGVQLASDASFAKYFEGVFNLSNGSIENTGRAVSYSGSRSIENVGNGWYRCSIAVNTVDSNSTTIAGVVVQSTNDPTLNYTGNNTSGIYIWGAQLERSSTARPYISTTSTAVCGPRLEYDVNGNALGLLIEEESQNLLQYSEQFDNAAWLSTQLLAFGSGSIVNATAAPNGTITADLITPNTTLSTHSIWQAAVTVASGVSCTATWYVKPNGYTKIAIVENQLTGYYTSYDASASGSVLSQSNATGAITLLTNGWYRITHTSVSGGTSFRPQLFILPQSYTGGSVVGSWAANGTSGIYIWGAQLEQKPFATSYIPTAASGGVIRAADTCNLSIDLGNSWFNESEGTIMVEGDRLHSPALNATSLDSLFTFASGGSASITHYSDGTSEYFSLEDGTYTLAALSISLPNQPLLFVGSYSASSSEIYVSTNNTATQSQSWISLFATPDTITFGYSDTISTYLNGHIKSFKYYKKSLDSTIMEALPL